MNNGEYVQLGNLPIYKLSIDLGGKCWSIYQKFDWHDKKIIGDQFITAIDSIGANFAEGYGRYHYLDRIKFYYNSRGSLLESKHWSLLLLERGFIDKNTFYDLLNLLNEINRQLNTYIKSCRPK